MHCVHMLIYY